MFLECSYFFTKSEADVLINSVLRQNTAFKVCNWSMEERGEKAKAGNIANILENCMCRHHMSYVLYHDNRFPSGQERIRASRAANTFL